MAADQCWSCDRRPTHMSPNTLIKVCDIHLHTLVGTRGYVPIPTMSDDEKEKVPAATTHVEEPPC